MVARQFRVGLEGREAELGTLAAADFARTILGLERVLARAAGHVLGNPVGSTGRRRRVIEEAVRIRLVGVERGSVRGVFEMPSAATDGSLGLSVGSLGELALDSALATANGREVNHHDVASAWVELADQIGIGSRIDAVRLDPGPANGDSTRALLNRSARDRLERVARRQPLAREDVLAGVLVEADFERQTARLRTVTGDRVLVTFPEDMALQVKEGLREPTELIGEVRYDPRTLNASDVVVREIVRAQQLSMSLDPGEAWTVEGTIEELAREQGVGIVVDVDQLRETTASDEEVDRLFSALGIEA